MGNNSTLFSVPSFWLHPGTQIGKGQGRWGQREKARVTGEAAGLGCVRPRETVGQWYEKAVPLNDQHITYVNTDQMLSS